MNEKLPHDEIIIIDKCDSHKLDRECPNPPTVGICYFGQYGHKYVFLFCEECYIGPDPWQLFRNEIPLPIHRVQDHQYLERYNEDNPGPSNWQYLV